MVLSLSGTPGTPAAGTATEGKGGAGGASSDFLAHPPKTTRETSDKSIPEAK